MTDQLDKFSLLSFPRALRQIMARLDALEGAGGGVSSETITTGASPTAADPDKAVTFITTGGTGGVEIITLGLPSSPGSKVGNTKRFIVADNGDPSDLTKFDATNIVGSDGEAINEAFAQNEFSGVGSVFDLRLIYNSGYAWQVVQLIAFGFEPNLFAKFIYPFPRASGDGQILELGGGNTLDGQGGQGHLSGGNGGGANGAGGDARINGGNASGDGRGGDVLLQPSSGAGAGRRGLVIVTGAELPTSDPHVYGALYNVSGTVKISAGS